MSEAKAGRLSLTLKSAVESVDEIEKRIKELGGTLDSEPADMPWGVRMFRLRDPDGFKFAISSPLAV